MKESLDLARLAEYRAQALLTVAFSRRGDLVIEASQLAAGVDYYVRIIRDGKITHRMFGVQLKAVTTLSDDIQARLRTLVRPESWYAEVPFPLCLIVFAMDTDQGYYRWLVKPVVAHNGETRLIIEHQDAFYELSEANLRELVTMINTWYENKKTIAST